mmetsp:Transcript_28945/g.74256  ORF Transcript_28945/g.74256 Transcript_28945/m.74256 type:complete len:492 (-) Transcript_28945:1419-2894(-)
MRTTVYWVLPGIAAVAGAAYWAAVRLTKPNHKSGEAPAKSLAAALDHLRSYYRAEMTNTELVQALLDALGPEALDEGLRELLVESLEIVQMMARTLNLDKLHMPVITAMLSRQHAFTQRNRLNPTADQETATGPGVDDLFIAKARHFLQMADLVYCENTEKAGLASRDIFLDRMSEAKAACGSNLPRHAVFVDHLTRSVVLAIRGTASFKDCVVDAVAVPTEALDGRGISHKGIASAASDMLEAVMPYVTEALHHVPGYTPIVTGHSLGAGTALMLALTLRHQADFWKEKLPSGTLEALEVFAFAPPPVWAPLSSLSEADTKGLYVFINNLDMIPRSTLRNLEVFFNQLALVDQAVAEDYSTYDLITVLMGMDSGDLAQEISRRVASAVEQADKERESEKKEWQHEQLFHPGRIFHLHPSTEGASGAEEFQHGLVPTTAEGYHLQELSASDLAAAPFIEGEGWVQHHLTLSYLRAMQRLVTRPEGAECAAA